MSQIARGGERRLGWNLLQVTRTSSFTGRVHVMELAVTEAEWRAWRVDGALIQHAMPGLTATEREFIMTGATQDEWDAVFGNDNREETT